jgi:hypothetical protein
MSVIPVAFYIAICFLTKSKTQLLVAGILSAFYAGVMMVVLVGIIGSLVSDSILNPSLLFILLLGGCFILGGIIHPYEFDCLPHGIIYYLLIPAGYLILIIYAFGNMNSVSWGTREVAKKKTKKEQEEDEKQKKEDAKKKKEKRGFLSFLRIDHVVKDMKDMVMQMFQSRESATNTEQIHLMRQMNKTLRSMKKTMKGTDDESDNDEERGCRGEQPTKTLMSRKQREARRMKEEVVQEEVIVEEEKEDPNYPHWVKDLEKETTEHAIVEQCDVDELLFWETFIKKYEKPLKADKQKEAALTAGLLKMKNDVNFALWFINFLWVLFNYMVQTSPDIKDIKLADGYTVQPLGFLFLIAFFLVMILQLVGMFLHRWGTFLQLMSITELPRPWRDTNDMRKKGFEEIVAIAKDMGKAKSRYFEPAPDYGDQDKFFAGAQQHVTHALTEEQMRETLRQTVRSRASIPWYNRQRREEESDQNRNYHGRDHNPNEPAHHEAVSRALWDHMSRPNRHRHRDEGAGRHRHRDEEAGPSSGKVRQRGRSQPRSRSRSPPRHGRRHRRHHRSESPAASHTSHGENHRHKKHRKHKHRRDHDEQHPPKQQHRQYEFDKMFDYRFDRFLENNGQHHAHHA